MSKYLIRLDDACPTMDREKWALVESALDRLNIKPIVAVIPDNKYPSIYYADADPYFWDKVRGWQKKGWTIAMHGYQHVFHKTRRNLIPRFSQSEFSGLSLASQREKIRKGWRIFLSEGVEPTVWVAPKHGFDEVTIAALLEETTIKVLSDGYALKCFYEHGITWFPQQLWSYVGMPFGIYTICLHPNTCSEKKIIKLFKKIRRERSLFIEVTEVNIDKRKRLFLEKVAAIIAVLVIRFLTSAKKTMLCSIRN